MEENNIKCNSPKAWVLAARPKTLAGAAVPVMIGLSLAFQDVGKNNFEVIPALLCFFFAFLMQIDANFINDYFDFVRGNDDETRLGPKRACAQGWITTRLMRIGILITTLLACGVGLPLIIYGGVEMLLIGMFCVLFCFLYTTSLAQLGLGDLLVLVFFGIVPVCTVYYIQSGTVSLETFAISVACGFVIDALLLINNYRDIENDAKAGKKTLVVRIGAEGGRLAYLLSGFIAILIGAVFLFNGNILAFLLPFLYLTLHLLTFKKLVRINKGMALNTVLGDTARNIFVYGLLVSIGIIINNVCWQ
ncbi:MAG: 1,4-dihydroxy-2-naphthoate octaprenyltransferase [Prevotella sp.]|nr:1,4-dihydroxy-2-naphthoate octaprenyltransferase [Prevotella sp.]